MTSEEAHFAYLIKEVKKYIPGPKGEEIRLDGMQTPHVRPSDKIEQKEMYSGKIKRYSLNTLVAVNKNGVLDVRNHGACSKHDVVMTPELGDTFTRMTNKWMQSEHAIHVVIDPRFQGITKYLPA